MKKALRTTLALLLLLLIVFSGCSTTPQGSSSPAPSSNAPTSTGPANTGPTGGGSSEPVTITMWSAGRHDYEIYAKPNIDAWNANNPDIQIDYQIYTENFAQTVEIAAQNGELPDLIIAMPQTMVTMLIQRGEVASLEPFMTAEEKASLDPSMFVEGLNLVDGEAFSLPSTGTAMRLVINNDIFEECGLSGPPTTVDELIEYAKIIHEKKGSEGVYGFALPMNNPTDGLQRGFTSITALDGAPVHNGFDFQQGRYDFSWYKPLLIKFRELWESGAVFPGCESLNIDPLRTQFAAGKIGMYMTYNHSEWGVYTAQFPTEVHWTYEMLPTMTGEIKGSQKLSGGTGWMMLNSCENKEAAYKVYQYFNSDENRTKFYELGLGISMLPDIVNNAPVPEAVQYTPFMAFQPSDKIWPLEPIAIVLEGDQYGTEFAKYINGITDDLDGIIEACNERYNAAYDK